MKSYTIKINGSGTPEQIAEALRSLAVSVECDLVGDSAEWEDPILSTEIELEEEE